MRFGAKACTTPTSTESPSLALSIVTPSHFSLSLSLPPKTHSKYTNGGMLPSADGSLPKLRPEQREVVTEYIPEVMRIMDRLEQQGHHHRDARVALYATEALSYEVSTKSVVKAARTLWDGMCLRGEEYFFSGQWV